MPTAPCSAAVDQAAAEPGAESADAEPDRGVRGVPGPGQHDPAEVVGQVQRARVVLDQAAATEHDRVGLVDGAQQRGDVEVADGADAVSRPRGAGSTEMAEIRTPWGASSARRPANTSSSPRLVEPTHPATSTFIGRPPVVVSTPPSLERAPRT